MTVEEYIKAFKGQYDEKHIDIIKLIADNAFKLNAEENDNG
mgnify:CR=1 FL=1